MKSFCCFASGENFPGVLKGKVEPIGFFVSVFVDAADSIEAKSKSLEMLSKHPDLALPDGVDLPANAKISFKVVHELTHHVANPKVTEFQYFDMVE